jgi:hypothetical protein
VCVCVFVCDKVLEVDKKKLGRGQGSGGDDMHVSSSSKDMHVSSSSYIHTGRGQGIGGGRHADRRRSGCSLDSQVREYIAIDEDMLCYFCTHICTPYTHTHIHTHTHTHTHTQWRTGDKREITDTSSTETDDVRSVGDVRGREFSGGATANNNNSRAPQTL